MKKRIIIIVLAAAAIASYGWSDRKLSRPSDGIEIDKVSPKADARGISETRKDILEAKIRESAYGKRIRAASQAAVPEVKAKDDGYDYKPETMPETTNSPESLPSTTMAAPKIQTRNRIHVGMRESARS